VGSNRPAHLWDRSQTLYITVYSNHCISYTVEQRTDTPAWPLSDSPVEPRGSRLLRALPERQFQNHFASDPMASTTCPSHGVIMLSSEKGAKILSARLKDSVLGQKLRFVSNQNFISSTTSSSGIPRTSL
jgi:hypothetical protein